MVFPSVEAAARYVEPIDVRNHEYVAYDSAGFLLKLVPTEPLVSIPGYLSDIPHQDQLEQALRSFFERATGAPAQLDRGSLEELLELFLTKFGYTR